MRFLPSLGSAIANKTCKASGLGFFYIFFFLNNKLPLLKHIQLKSVPLEIQNEKKSLNFKGIFLFLWMQWVVSLLGISKPEFLFLEIFRFYFWIFVHGCDDHDVMMTGWSSGRIAWNLSLLEIFVIIRHIWGILDIWERLFVQKHVWPSYELF